MRPGMETTRVESRSRASTKCGPLPISACGPGFVLRNSARDARGFVAQEAMLRAYASSNDCATASPLQGPPWIVRIRVFSLALGTVFLRSGRKRPRIARNHALVDKAGTPAGARPNRRRPRSPPSNAVPRRISRPALGNAANIGGWSFAFAAHGKGPTPPS